jgi:uncharacterized protein (DUF486 family)
LGADPIRANARTQPDPSLRRLGPSRLSRRHGRCSPANWGGFRHQDAPKMPTPSLSVYLAPILMLSLSNVFMTFAWYGHLRYKMQPLVLVIVASWLIAFFEYCLAVPANRYGNTVYSAAQLKTIQEVITLTVFAAFSVLYLKEPIGPNQIIGFALIAAGAAFVFSGKG